MMKAQVLIVVAMLGLGFWGGHQAIQGKVWDCFGAAPWDQEHRYVWCKENWSQWKRLDATWDARTVR